MRLSFALLPVVLFSTLFLSGCFKTKAQLSKEKTKQEMRQRISQTVDGHTDQLERLNRTMGELIGKIEAMEFSHRQEGEKDRLSMTSFGEQLSSMGDRVKKIEIVQKEIVKDMSTLKRKSISSTKKVTFNFQAGINSFNKKQYKKAASIFQSYLTRYPNGRRASRASELLGESYYSMGKYEDTIIAYSNIYEKQKKGRLWRKSVLRIAQSFYKLGKKKDAKSFAETLVESYPKSQEAKKVKKYL